MDVVKSNCNAPLTTCPGGSFTRQIWSFWFGVVIPLENWPAGSRQLSAFPQECWGLSTDEFPFLLPSHNAESVSPAALLATTMLTRRGAGSVRPTVSPASAATVISAYPVNMATFWMKTPAAVLLSALMGHIRIPVSCFLVFQFWKRQGFHLSNSMHGIWTLLSTKQNLAGSSKRYFRSIV